MRNIFNKGLSPREIAFDMAAAGMDGAWKVRDVWRQKDEGVARGVYKANVYGHATHLVRFIPGADAKLRVRDIRDNAYPEEGHRLPTAGAKLSAGCKRCDVAGT